MDNLITYKEGASFMSFRDWQETIETNGEGTSYGMELFTKEKGENIWLDWLHLILDQQTL